MELLRIFVGYDEVESVSWHTMVHSIFENASIPIAIIPIYTKNLRQIYNRPRDSKQSNAFSYTRFLVPYLCGYKGYGIFFDCDMMIRVDIKELLNIAISRQDKAVHVVKHEYTPKDKVKYLGTTQYNYPRKNWSSVVVWNCEHPSNSIVTPEFVNESTPANLHRFLWLNDEEIGELPVTWNWLVGEYNNPPKDVKNVHWTVGGPYFKEYKDVDFSEEWRELFERTTFCKQKNK